MDKWDTSLKQLVGESPQDFISWLVPEAEFKAALTGNMNNREIEADLLYEVEQDGNPGLVSIELQSYADETMAKRVWEYNFLATFSYHRPTYSFVIYLRPCEVGEPFYRATFLNGKETHLFHFSIVKLWELDPEEIKDTGLAGLYPLMALAREGNHPAVLEEVITGIETSGRDSTAELLSLTYLLASFVFTKPTDIQWLKRRFHTMRHILEDTWAYQEIKQEGRQEGMQEGLRQSILNIMHVRFHALKHRPASGSRS